MTKPKKTATPTMNDKRAAWAGIAMDAFTNEVGTDFEDSLCDLLCDLMHWADRRGFDFSAELARATTHYDFEFGEDR